MSVSPSSPEGASPPWHNPPRAGEGSRASPHVERPKKQMRKGTRSCLQCRQRKVACSFQLEVAKTCKQCSKRGIACREQEYDVIHSHKTNQSNAAGVTDRVNQLEDLIKDLWHRVPGSTENGGPDGSVAFDLARAAEMMANLKTSTLQTSDDILPGISSQAPIMSLFDNSVLTRHELPEPVSSYYTTRHQAILSALRATLPEQDLVEKVIDASHGGWQFLWWTVFPFTQCPPDQIQMPLRQLLASENPTVVAKAIVYIALNICHLPPNYDIQEAGFPGPRHEVMERYMDIVDRLVTSDDLFAASLDGIECIALQVKYYTNLGRTRRAWLLVRRAIGVAQQCGLVHFMSPSKMRYPIDERRVAKLWGYLLMADLHLSLLLGLSHCVSDQMLASYREAVDNLPGFLDGERYQAKMFPIIRKLIERNQDSNQPSISLTLQIDNELEQLSHTHPPRWWHLSTAAEAGISLEEHYSRRSAQFFHHQVRAVLHMPFMLSPAPEGRHIFSYNMTLESSREIIRTFRYLKAESELALALSRLYDFFTFTAAVTILLSLVGYGGQANPLPPNSSPQSQDDSRLVDTAIALLRAASVGPTGRVPSQCARALELLGLARHSPSGDVKPGSTLQISIPYFGRIRLGPGRGFRSPGKGQGPSADTTITPDITDMAPPFERVQGSEMQTDKSECTQGMPGPSGMGFMSLPTPDSAVAPDFAAQLPMPATAPGSNDNLLVGLDTMGSFADFGPYNSEYFSNANMEQDWLGAGFGGPNWAVNLDSGIGWGGTSM